MQDPYEICKYFRPFFGFLYILLRLYFHSQNFIAMLSSGVPVFSVFLCLGCRIRDRCQIQGVKVCPMCFQFTAGVLRVFALKVRSLIHLELFYMVEGYALTSLFHMWISRFSAPFVGDSGFASMNDLGSMFANNRPYVYVLLDSQWCSVDF